jgi:hypothetical protein
MNGDRENSFLIVAEDEFIVTGKAIAEVLGESEKSIPNLVKNEGLPAYRRNGTGPYRTMRMALLRWGYEQIKRHLNHTD